MNNKNLELVASLLEKLDTTSQLDDFIKSFATVVALFKAMKSENEKERDELSRTFSSALRDVKNKTQDQFDDLERELIGKIDARIDYLKSVADGLPDLAEVEAGLGKIKDEAIKEAGRTILKNVGDEFPKWSVKIRDALELLDGDERLDVKAIKGLEEKLDGLKKDINEKPGKVVFVGSSSANGGRIVRSYDLSPHLNGSTTKFTLPPFWRIISIHASSFPHTFIEGTDFTVDISDDSITFTSEIEPSTTLASGQTITVVYSEK